MTRRVCVFTGTRAEYGLLRWPMHELRATEGIHLQTLVSGTHLSPQFGLTVREIEADGFAIDERVEMLLSGDSAVAVTKSLGLATIGYGEALDRLRPDILVLLGDRYEVLAAAQAATLSLIPIAHVHGGEASEGAIDEAIRHAVTKLSHIHFVASERFRRRVVQMGEAPDRVHVVGAPGLDNIHRLDLLDRDALEAELGCSLGSPLLLVTYHPATLTAEGPRRAMDALLGALDAFPDATIVFTMPNADPRTSEIRLAIERYVAQRLERVHAFESLGSERYLSLMQAADVVVGNSSSGLIEAPALQTATVNLGSRQRGRLRGDSVIDCGETREEVESAIRRAISARFRALVSAATSQYGDGKASARIADTLATVELDGLLLKRFHSADPPLERPAGEAATAGAVTHGAQP